MSIDALNKTSSYLKALLVFILVSRIISFFLSEVLYLIAGNRGIFTVFGNETLSQLFWDAVLFAPILESLLLCGVLEFIVLLFKHFEKPHAARYSILIAGVLFGGLHFYNVYYILATIPLFTIYGYAYFFFKNRYQFWLAFLALVLIHAADNALTVFFDYVI